MQTQRVSYYTSQELRCAGIYAFMLLASLQLECLETYQRELEEE